MSSLTPPPLITKPPFYQNKKCENLIFYTTLRIFHSYANNIIYESLFFFFIISHFPFVNFELNTLRERDLDYLNIYNEGLAPRRVLVGTFILHYESRRLSFLFANTNSKLHWMYSIKMQHRFIECAVESPKRLKLRFQCIV